MLRTARLRRRPWAVGGVAIAVVVGGLVGCSSAANHAATAPASTVSGVSPITSGPASTGPAGQSYPARGASYVVVPDGSQLVWTDLKTGATGHFGPTTGQVSSPSVSADGRRIAYIRVTDSSTTVDYWDLDTRQSRTVIETPGSNWIASPSISPDGAHFAWYEQGGGISFATREADSQSGSTVVSDGDDPTWVGNGAIAYLPQNRNTGGDCAVERMDLANRATHCLLPTATLQSVSAPGGQSWQITSVSEAGDTGLLSLVVATPDNAGPVSMAVAILDPSAEATPFHVLSSTVTNPLKAVLGFSAVVVDQGRRVVYSVRGTDAVTEIRVASVSGGTPSTVGTTGDGLGLGATSG